MNRCVVLYVLDVVAMFASCDYVVCVNCLCFSCVLLMLLICCLFMSVLLCLLLLGWCCVCVNVIYVGVYCRLVHVC